MELIWINYVWFDPVRHGYVGNHNGAAKLESTWCYVVFDSDLRNLHRGGELWGEKNKRLEDGSFLKDKV